MELNEYSFKNLFGEHTNNKGETFIIESIEIPIIQRDYAQGRKNERVVRVRNRFLETLYDALTKDNHITLDFVYGEITNKKFIPLDGQQRLTTLFLLHWYIAKKELIEANEYEFLLHFSYFTRPSSRDFCHELVSFLPSLTCTISEEIKDQSWFQYQWLSDPTICGMLVMIDAIQEKFQSTTNIWQTLVVEPCISFYFLPITEMGLSDDLYIKMNSRGKPLTDFEHFKAEFEGIVDEFDKNLSQQINHKFDIEWTDMLFPYRGDNQIIDDEFMRYFFFVSDILCYQQNIPLDKDEFALAQKLYNKNNPLVTENLNFLVQSFDCWCNMDIDDFFSQYFSSFQYQTGKTKIYQENLNIFKQCCDTYGEYEGRNRKFPLNMTLLLYAIIIYLQNKDSVSIDNFQRRIRIVRNLIWNSQYEIRADGQRNNMPQLLLETKEIILNGIILEGVGYNQKQKEEERQKIDWLKENDLEKDRLFRLEDYPLLYGCIAIVGLDHPQNFDKFRDLFDNVEKVSIHRALLIYDNYSQTASGRYYMGSKNNSTWRDLFHPTDIRKGFNRTKNAINLLLDAMDEVAQNKVNQIIEQYCSESQPPYDWRYYFIVYPSMLRGDEGILWIEQENSYVWYTLRRTTFGGYNWISFANVLNKLKPELFDLHDWAWQNDSLFIKGTNMQIIINSDNFEIVDGETTICAYTIPQNNNIDTVDRIQYFLNIYQNEKTKFKN